MALLERVATLVRANLNDLIDKAEEPEKMIKQVILDMQNQLLQVKTQVAIAIADQHLLAKKAAENEEKEKEWMRKAELAVEKKDDSLARAALERAMGYKDLKAALHKLEGKLAEAQSKSDLLIARHRRARVSKKASEAKLAMAAGAGSNTFDRMKERVSRAEAVSQAWAEMTSDDVDDRFAAIEKEKEVDRLLSELKSRKLLGA
jgi:phage shock protein A